MCGGCSGKEKMSKVKAFTMTEILITIVVASIIAALALPNFTRSVEKTRANQAISYLRVIRTGERMYQAKWGTYQTFANTAAIQADLGAATRSDHYTFRVDAPPAGTIETGFVATATGADGSTIILSDDGTWSGTSAHVPPS